MRRVPRLGMGGKTYDEGVVRRCGAAAVVIGGRGAAGGGVCAAVEGMGCRMGRWGGGCVCVCGIREL